MANFSGLIGKVLAGKKSQGDEKKNKKRLDDAASASRGLGAQRIADNEIKKLTSRLCYEADGYITAAKGSEGAVYDPLVLDALDNSLAAINVWKKNENEAAAGKYLGVNGIAGGIIIPAQDESVSGENSEMREKTLGILRESLSVFIIQNSIRTASDPQAALIALLSPESQTGQAHQKEIK